MCTTCFPSSRHRDLPNPPSPGCKPHTLDADSPPPVDADPLSRCKPPSPGRRLPSLWMQTPYPWSCDQWCILGSQPPSPPLWTEWQTHVRTLLYTKLLLRAVKTAWNWENLGSWYGSSPAVKSSNKCPKWKKFHLEACVGRKKFCLFHPWVCVTISHGCG